MEKKVRDFSKKELADLENRLAKAGFIYDARESVADVFDEDGEEREDLYSAAYVKSGAKKTDFPDLVSLADTSLVLSETGNEAPDGESGDLYLFFFLYYDEND